MGLEGPGKTKRHCKDTRRRPKQHLPRLQTKTEGLSPLNPPLRPHQVLGTAVPMGPGRCTFLAHFSPSQATPMQSQAPGTAAVNPKPAAKKARASGLRKR